MIIQKKFEMVTAKEFVVSVRGQSTIYIDLQALL